MAKVRGPLFSSDAAGGFGRSLLFRGGPGGSRVSRHPALSRKPSGGPTAAQEAQRAAYAAAVAAWHALSPEERAEWAAQAAATGRLVTGYNLFLAAHMRGDIAPPPPPPTVALRVRVRTDRYPAETSVALVDAGGAEVFARGYAGEAKETEVVDVVVVEPGSYTFTIFDSYGDGLCCSYGQGWYRVEGEDGTVYAAGAKFARSEATTFTL